MAGRIGHATQADNSFSAAGVVAWEEDHVIEESGGQALGIGAISGGQFVKRVGNNLVGAAVPGSDIVYAAAPNSDFDLTVGGLGGAVEFFRGDIAGISAGDTLSVEARAVFMNNSGGTRAYSPTYSLGTLSIVASGSQNVANNATNFSPLRISFTVAITSTILAGSELTNAVTTAALANGALGGAPVNSQASNRTTNDLTGTQTLSLSMTSNSVAGTQTLRLQSIVIRKVAAT